MIDVDLPGGDAVPELVRSFAACIAAVTETPVDEVPQPEAELSGAIGYWRSWLAARGAGLVKIAKPGSFQWPGTGWRSWERRAGRRTPTRGWPC